jgi:DNA-directed RNA polymerase specialized sigma24 family protein
MNPRTSIGGALTANAYAALATRHRPSDQGALRREIVRLNAELHLSPRDIAQALCVDLSDVHEALGEGGAKVQRVDP